jgi:hypothetical protein
MLRRSLVRDFLAVVALTTALGAVLSVLSARLAPEWYWEAGAPATVDPRELSALQPLVMEFPDAERHPGWSGDIGRRLVGLPGIVRVRGRGQDGRILWSSEREEPHQLRPESRELRDALLGRVVVQLTQATPAATHEAGLDLAARAIVDLPILCDDAAEELGVLELARAPGRLRPTRPWL